VPAGVAADEPAPSAQRFGWALQRIGWVVLAAWLLASALGATGPGAASRSLATTPDRKLSVYYDRVLHRGAPTRLVVFVERERAGALELALGGAYAEAFGVTDLVPEPRSEGVSPAQRRFTLELDDAGLSRIVLTLSPLTSGWQTGELSVDGRRIAGLRHLVLP
jgi:hypothetical protein